MRHSRHANTEVLSDKLLEIYLADHLAGSTAGCARMSRMASAYADTPQANKLSEISCELRMERAVLKRIMREQRYRSHSLRQFIAWAGEHLGRLKGNGSLFTVSPLTLLLELEIMRSAVAGKLGLWQTLHANAADLRLDSQLLALLIDQTKQQAEKLECLHELARLRSFRAEGDSSMSHDEQMDAAAGHGGAACAEGTATTVEPAHAVDKIDAPVDVAERPGTSHGSFDHSDALVDEWGKDSF